MLDQGIPLTDRELNDLRRSVSESEIVNRSHTGHVLTRDMLATIDTLVVERDKLRRALEKAKRKNSRAETQDSNMVP